MNSTAEPALARKISMDDIYRFQRHFYDVTRRYYLLGRDDLLAGLNPADGASVLEIGCGTGRNLVGAALSFPNAAFFGFDISEEMLKTAGTNLVRARLSSKVKIACADATAFDAQKVFGRGRFDRIYFSYTLSMIPDWQVALHGALQALEPEGELHIIDFGQCAQLPKLFRKLLFSWLTMFHVQPREQLLQVLEQECEALGAAVSFTPLYRDYAWLMVAKAPS